MRDELAEHGLGRQGQVSAPMVSGTISACSISSTAVVQPMMPRVLSQIGTPSESPTETTVPVSQ